MQKIESKSIEEGHIYHRKFLELLSKQPKDLSELEKLQRIDRLSCYEAESLTRLMNPTWLYMLGIIISFYYTELLPEVVETEAFKKTAKALALRYKDSVRYNLSPEYSRDFLLSYLENRKELTRVVSTLIQKKE
jgi:hypothetical protein